MRAIWTAEQMRQARENLEAVLRHYGLPSLDVALRFEDRCFWRPTDEWFARLRDLTLTGKFRSWDGFGNHGVAATASFRENVPRHSLQIVVHGVGHLMETDVAIEADIDQWNPDYGAYPALRHLLTDVLGATPYPYDIRAGLLKRGISVGLIGEQVGGFLEDAGVPPAPVWPANERRK